MAKNDTAAAGFHFQTLALNAPEVGISFREEHDNLLSYYISRAVFQKV